MARYRKQRQLRYNRLTAGGFFPQEARTLSQFSFKLPYIRLMRRERQRMIAGLSLPVARATIIQQYIDRGWKDAYAMMRDYREKSIDKGEYFPPPKPRRKPTEKGDMIAQRARRQERETGRVSPVTMQKWIAELDANIASATGVRKRQLRAQRQRLEKLL